MSPSLSAVPAALLLAETRLRLGERDAARDRVLRLLDAGPTPIGRARAYALLATCAAIEGNPTEALGHLRQTTGVSGPGQGWLNVHRAWCAVLLDGRPPERVEVPLSPIELALVRCVDELGGPVPAWAGRP